MLATTIITSVVVGGINIAWGIPVAKRIARREEWIGFGLLICAFVAGMIAIEGGIAEIVEYFISWPPDHNPITLGTMIGVLIGAGAMTITAKGKLKSFDEWIEEKKKQEQTT